MQAIRSRPRNAARTDVRRAGRRHPPAVELGQDQPGGRHARRPVHEGRREPAPRAASNSSSTARRPYRRSSSCSPHRAARSRCCSRMGSITMGRAAWRSPMDAVRGDLEARRKSGMIEALDKHYQKLGLKVVAVAISATKGYHLVLRRRSARPAICRAADFAARELSFGDQHAGRRPGRAAGRRGVLALEKGVVDGAAWPASGVLGMRWYEVAKYMLRPSFGLSHYLFLINLNAGTSSATPSATFSGGGPQGGGDLVQGIRPHGGRGGSRPGPGGMQITELAPTQKQKLQATWAQGNGPGGEEERAGNGRPARLLRRRDPRH